MLGQMKGDWRGPRHEALSFQLSKVLIAWKRERAFGARLFLLPASTWKKSYHHSLNCARWCIYLLAMPLVHGLSYSPFFIAGLCSELLTFIQCTALTAPRTNFVSKVSSYK